MKRVILLSAFGLTLARLSVSCDQNPLAYQTDTHSRGNIKIYVEESFKPLFETSIYTFEGLYPKAKIHPVYETESQIIKDFFANKTKTICITRDFTKEEKASLRKANVEVRSDIIAYDAVALIVNTGNVDSMLTVAQVKDMLTGKMTAWATSRQPVSVVFDQEQSANFHYLYNLIDKAPLSKNVFAVKSNEEVINYVKKTPNAIGVIGVNWISDTDDKNVMNFLDGVRVVSVAETDKHDYFPPYQAYMNSREYPFIREVWMINKGGRAGLNSGFVNFMLQEKGQLLINKSSLLPAKMVIRVIEMTEE